MASCFLKKFYCIASSTASLLLIECAAFFMLSELHLQEYWIALPIAIYIFLVCITKYIKQLQIKKGLLELASALSCLFLFTFIHFSWIFTLIKPNFDVFSVVIILCFFINLFVSKTKKDEANLKENSDTTSRLFNLFYLNTSKAHEIAMLIDNKIMKTIEREQVSEELLKYNTSISLGQSTKASADMGYSFEDSSKKRVYENFDVKTTKSIMLRKIYETALKKKGDQQYLHIGDLTIFENIELQQMNIDDTVMILNVLQDSKIKNQASDSIEINLNKMMDKMLDDFTIDYQFTIPLKCKDKASFIIRIPYKSTDNFENGYQHNDLQLGKLSVIGIYRGEIDFSKRDSISSKFLEMMSESYNQEINKKENAVEMKLSSGGSISNNIQFEFNHKKLDKEMQLIDVIAIIQELNFDKDD